MCDMLRSVIERKDSELDAELIQCTINLATAMQLPADADDPLFAQAQTVSRSYMDCCSFVHLECVVCSSTVARL